MYINGILIYVPHPKKMYHIFFIPSYVDGHLHCFHVLAIINSAAVNTEVRVSFWIMFFSGYMPRSGIILLCFRNSTLSQSPCLDHATRKIHGLMIFTQWEIRFLNFFLLSSVLCTGVCVLLKKIASQGPFSGLEDHVHKKTRFDYRIKSWQKWSLAILYLSFCEVPVCKSNLGHCSQWQNLRNKKDFLKR